MSEVRHKHYSKSKTAGLELFEGRADLREQRASSHVMRDSTQETGFSEVLLGKVLSQGKPLSEVAGGAMKK